MIEQTTDGAPSMRVKPCTGCRHAKRCELEVLACDALVIWRRVSTNPVRWQNAPRFPSKALYERAHAPLTAPRAHRQAIEEIENETEE